MSQPESNEIRVGFLSYVNIYTTMLALSVVAMLIAVVLLVIELSRLDWDPSARAISHVSSPRQLATSSFISARSGATC